jgi:NAD(P)-dependent dehydrogenase (short-subunit alcohol dehydrogenase family)
MATTVKMATTASEVAIVSGAASGMGAATAIKLAARGACVTLFDLNGEGLTQTARVIESRGGQCLAVVGSVSSNEDSLRAVDSTIEKFGRLDTAVACAGIVKFGTVIETTVSEWEDVLGVNLRGVFLLAKHSIPHLIEAKGSFCAISSDNGRMASQGIMAYNVSKHGVLGIVRSLAIDHGPQGVRSNAVCPGPVNTPMMQAVIAGENQPDTSGWTSMIPLGRFAEPGEIANVIAHLTSSEASYTNGLVYMVEGGSSAGYFAPIT